MRQADAELRAKREAAQEQLRARPRKLSESFGTAAIDDVFAAAGGGSATDGDRSDGLGLWVSEQLQREVAATEKRKRLSLFEADLNLLSISLDEAVSLDEKKLRKAFWERSHVLHPDVRSQRRPEELAGMLSVYELVPCRQHKPKQLPALLASRSLSPLSHSSTLPRS